jgi:hypothetical protein
MKKRKRMNDLEASEAIMEWGKTNGGTAREIQRQLSQLKGWTQRQISELCERLVAEGRLLATRVPVPDGRYVGRSLKKSLRYM